MALGEPLTSKTDQPLKRPSDDFSKAVLAVSLFSRAAKSISLGLTFGPVATYALTAPALQNNRCQRWYFRMTFSHKRFCHVYTIETTPYSLFVLTRPSTKGPSRGLHSKQDLPHHKNSNSLLLCHSLLSNPQWINSNVFIIRLEANYRRQLNYAVYCWELVVSCNEVTLYYWNI